jgi:hypothetical protein
MKFGNTWAYENSEVTLLDIQAAAKGSNKEKKKGNLTT